MRGSCPPLSVRSLAAAAALAVVLPLTAAGAAYSAPGDPGKPPDRPGQAPAKPGDKPDEDKKKPEKKPAKKPDREAPAPPQVGTPTAGAEGSITVTVRAEKGARVVVREPGGPVVAEGQAVGGSVTLSWTAETGEQTYAATATDKAGNRSEPTRFSAEADADPPPLRRVTWTPGTSEDSRSRVAFRTAPGTAYQVLVDGGVVAEGTAEDRAVTEVLDVADGKHSVGVEAVDEVGNVASRSRGFRVDVGRLAVDAELTSEPTTREQVVRVSATPNATTGTVKVSGAEPRKFALRNGRAVVRFPLPDDEYGGLAVTVRDSQGRRGVGTVDAFEVDTSAPVLRLDTDSRAAGGGRLEATVSTDPGTRVTWTLLTPGGVAAESGTFTAGDGETTISRDVDAGTYELKVVATDRYDRTVTRTAATRIAADPTPIWLIVLAGLGVMVAGIALVFLLPLLLKRLFRPLATRRERRRLEAADAARRDHLAERAALRDARAGRASVIGDFLFGVTTGWDVGTLPGFDPRPGETVRHMTVATAYEAQGHGPADHVTTLEGALVITGQRLVLLADEPHEWPIEDVRDLTHLSDEESVLHHTGDDERWTVLTYGEAETTRLHLDQLKAELQGRGPEHLAERRAELDQPGAGEEAVDLSAWV